MGLVFQLLGYGRHDLHAFQQDDLLPALCRKSVDIKVDGREGREIYRKMMDHVAVQHAHRREIDLVADDDEVALPAVERKAVPVRRINQVEILGSAVRDRFLNILPSKPPAALADDIHLVVVLVKRVGRVDLGAVLDDEVYDRPVLQETVRVAPRRLAARDLVPHDGRRILPEELVRRRVEHPRRGPRLVHHELQAEVGLLRW